MPFLIGLELVLMLRVCSATSQETADISAELHTNMSLLCWRKSTSSLSYLGFQLAWICTVLSGFLASICMPFAYSSTLKMLDVRGIVGLSGAIGNQTLSSRNLTVATAAAASSMLSCSYFNAHCALASMVMTPAGPCILSLR
jgi:hypothetical protein